MIYLCYERFLDPWEKNPYGSKLVGYVATELEAVVWAESAGKFTRENTYDDDPRHNTYWADRYIGLNVRYYVPLSQLTTEPPIT